MKILVIDIETTGKSPYDGHLIEVGGVFLETTTGKIEEAFDYLIKSEIDFNSEKETNAWIFKNSDMTIEDIKEKGVDIKDIREELQDLFDKYPTVAYNQKFDFSFLVALQFKINSCLPDPMLIATDVLKIENYYGYKWPKVQECLDYFKMNKDEDHRAASDAKVEAEIIYKLIKLGRYKIRERIEPKL